MRPIKIIVCVILGAACLLSNFCACKRVKQHQWEGTLVFSDEFEGQELRKYYWDYEEGCGGRGRHDTNLECFKKGTNNIHIENGSLIITARIEKSKEYNLGSYKREVMKYSSGKLSQSGFGVTYGTYVVRARLPKGKHLFPAIYLLPQNQRHEPCKYEEIDLVLARGQRTSTIIMGAQYGRAWNNVAVKSLEKVFRNKDFSADFHEFAVKWTATKIQWFVDGEKYYEANTHFRSDWTNKFENNEPCTQDKSLFSQKSALVIALSVGGMTYFPETKYGLLSENDAKDWAKPTLEIDWVKVYDSNAEEKPKITVFNIPGIDDVDDMLKPMHN